MAIRLSDLDPIWMTLPMSPVHGPTKRLLPAQAALARPTDRGRERTGIPLHSRISRSECIQNFISEEPFRNQERR